VQSEAGINDSGRSFIVTNYCLALGAKEKLQFRAPLRGFVRCAVNGFQKRITNNPCGIIYVCRATVIDVAGSN
jgi:hypothetical protein